MADASAGEKIVATVFNKNVSHSSALMLFERGNWLRYIAVVVLIIHAVMFIKKKQPQRELFIFALLQLIDILMRLPISSYNSNTQRQTVVRFGIIYVILSAMYAYTLMGPELSVLVFIVLAAATFVFITNTKKVKDQVSDE